MELTRERAVAMTVNERLFHADLLGEFDAASERKDLAAVRKILAKVFLDEQSIEANAALILENK